MGLNRSIARRSRRFAIVSMKSRRRCAATICRSMRRSICSDEAVKLGMKATELLETLDASDSDAPSFGRRDATLGAQGIREVPNLNTEIGSSLWRAIAFSI